MFSSGDVTFPVFLSFFFVFTVLNIAEVGQKDFHAFGSCDSVVQFGKRNQPTGLDRKTRRNY